jgi:hypothetical protein
MIKKAFHALLKFFNRFSKKGADAGAMTIEQVQPADVLLFSGNSIISEAIILLTGGGVSHAAMAYDALQLVHEVPEHAKMQPMKDLFSGREISVMRLREGHSLEALQGVLNAGKTYVDQAEPYPMSNLYLLGLILIYRRVTPNTKVQKWTVKILRAVIAEIEAYIRQRNTPDKLPMVCSQFVHQCYADGGVRLKIKDGVVLFKAAHTLAPAGSTAAEPTSLLDIALASPAESPAEPAAQQMRLLQAPSIGIEETPMDGEELARNLLSALQEEDSGEDNVDPELVNTVKLFGHAVNTLIADEGADTLLHKGRYPQSSSDRGMRLLSQNESMFVTPADLLLNCPALEKKGVIAV